MPEALSNLFVFYGELKRPLAPLEIWRLLKTSDKPESLYALGTALDKAVETGSLTEEEGFFSLKEFGLRVINRKKQDFLFDKKWRRLKPLARWFNFLPFIDFVFTSGSMALGNVVPTSDFDLLVGVKKGRLFTARYFALFLFSLLRLRRMDDFETSSPDKLCFNHFVTEKRYAKPPYNYYRFALYRSLAPLWGKKEKMLDFFKANKWCEPEPEEIFGDSRGEAAKPNIIRTLFEFALGSRLGDRVEDFLRRFAITRLQTYAEAKPSNGRIVIETSELEFHFNLPYEDRFKDLII